jgi:COMPASS component SWD3
MTLGQEYQIVAIQMIQRFLKERGMAGMTLAALELEYEDELRESVKLPTLPLLGMIDKYYADEDRSSNSQHDEFDATITRYTETSEKISLGNKLTCIDTVEYDKNIYILVGSTDKSIVILLKESKEVLGRIYQKSPILSVAINPNVMVAVSTSMDGTGILFNLNNPQVLQTLTGHTKYVHKALFSDNGEFLITCSFDKTVQFYKLNDCSQYEFLTKTSFSGIVEAACFVKTTLILGVRGDHQLHYVELDPWEHLKYNMNQNGDHWISFTPLDLAVSPCGKYVAVYTDSKAGRIIVYRAKSSFIVANFWDFFVDEFTKPSIVWHPNQPILVCSDKNDICILSLNETSKVQRLKGHSDAVRGLSFDQKGNLYSCSFDGQIRIWEQNTLLSSLSLN